MKKIIKNPIFTFILGILIFSGITVVSAYTIFANQISYTPKDTTWKKENGEDITNVSDAIDELYSKSNKFDTITIRLKGESNSSVIGSGTLEFSNFKNKYKYFKVSSLMTYGNSSNCKLYLYSNQQSDNLLGSSNTQYLVRSSTDGFDYSTVQLRSQSSSNSWASCEANITFYNVSG